MTLEIDSNFVICCELMPFFFQIFPSFLPKLETIQNSIKMINITNINYLPLDQHNCTRFLFPLQSVIL